MRTDRQTDMTTLIVGFRSYSEAPMNCYTYRLDYFSVMSLLELRGASTAREACAHKPSVSPSPPKCEFEVMSGWLLGLGYLEPLRTTVALLLV